MQQLFYQSCISGDVDQIKQLLTPPVMEALQPPPTNPNLSYSVLLYNYGIQIACKCHHTDVIRLLLEYKPMKPYVDFTMSNHFALRTVCREGFADVVRLILHYYPFQNLGYFTNIARQYGHTELVRILETPMYYRIFCDEDGADKVDSGIQLLSYQDILLPDQRSVLLRFMTDYLQHVFTRMPTDIIWNICSF